MHSGLMASCYLLNPPIQKKIRDTLQGANDKFQSYAFIRTHISHYHRFSVLTPDMTSCTVRAAVMLQDNYVSCQSCVGNIVLHSNINLEVTECLSTPVLVHFKVVNKCQSFRKSGVI